MFKQLIDKLTSVPSEDPVSQHDLQQASVQLLLEVARSDASIDDTERDAIIAAISDKANLQPAEIQALMTESEDAVDKSISFHQHVRLVNEQLDYSQKTQLVEQMWKVAFSDGVLDVYEEAFIRQIADLLYIKHRDFMQAKLRVVES